MGGAALTTAVYNWISLLLKDNGTRIAKLWEKLCDWSNLNFNVYISIVYTVIYTQKISQLLWYWYVVVTWSIHLNKVVYYLRTYWPISWSLKFFFPPVTKLLHVCVHTHTHSSFYIASSLSYAFFFYFFTHTYVCIYTSPIIWFQIL